MTTGATFNRGASKQDYETPAEFIEAVEKRFGPLAFDLAASEDNKKTPYYYGEQVDAFRFNWRNHRGLLWLNPPFDNIAPWAKKCAEESAFGAHILFLVPASVGSNWFRDYVFGKAVVYFLNGRLCFDGVAPYPKDCMLCEYGSPVRKEDQSFLVWTWKDSPGKPPIDDKHAVNLT